MKKTNTLPTTFNEYEQFQMKRWSFANGMSICEGSTEFAPKYSLMHYYNQCSDSDSFVKSIDEAVVSKMHFKIDTTDKAQLKHWFAMQNSNVDESEVANKIALDESLCTKSASQFEGLTVTHENGCCVFETTNPWIMESFIASLKDVEAELRANLTSYDCVLRTSCLSAN